MTAPIIGYGACEACGNTVGHRKGAKPTRYCSHTCKTRVRAIERPTAHRRHLARKRLRRRIVSIRKIAVLAVELQAMLGGAR